MKILGNTLLITLIVATILTVATFVLPEGQDTTSIESEIVAKPYQFKTIEAEELTEIENSEVVHQVPQQKVSERIPEILIPIAKPKEEIKSTSTEEIIKPFFTPPLTEEVCDDLLTASPFYMDPHMTILGKESTVRNEGYTDTADLLLQIKCYPQATWLTWKDAASMKKRVEDVTIGALTAGQIPVLVIYNSPDTGSTKWWVGNNGEEYLKWVRAVAEGIGDREAWVIVEPDALGLSTDYSSQDQTYRLNELRSVVRILKEVAPNAKVYLDGAHNKWKDPRSFAELLIRAGVKEADGFAQNISNYQSLEDEIIRGNAVSAYLGGMNYIIDTSRNGVGAPTDHEWCNARGRALGVHPTTDTGNKLIDAFLWIKPPGESDGTCNGGPTPGKFWLEYALELIENVK